MLTVVQMVGLGRGKEDFLDPFAAQKLRQKSVASGFEAAKDIAHGSAQILDRTGALIDRAKRIHQHDLPVNPRKVIAKERFDHLPLIRLEPPRHLA